MPSNTVRLPDVPYPHSATLAALRSALRSAQRSARRSARRSALPAALVAAMYTVGVAGCATRAPQDPAIGRTAAAAAPDAMVLDGAFADWQGTSPALTMDAPSPLASITLRDTPRHLFLQLAFRDSLNLQAMPGTLHLLLQTSPDVRTPHSVYGVSNVDLVVDFSRLDKLQAGGRGAGFALRTVTANGLGAFTSPYDIDVSALPTWASNRFEVRMLRTGTPLGTASRSLRLTAVYVAPDSTTYTSATIPWQLRTLATSEPRPRADTIPPLAAGAFRVAQWNVSEGSFRQPAMHARLLAAVTPDVLMLDELYEQVTADSLRKFFDLPELKALGPWQFVIAGGGGRQRTAVAARRRTVRPVPSMTAMQYEPGVLDSLKRVMPPAAHRLIEIEEQAQISSVGAWVDMDGTDVMFVPLDLQSGGFAGSVHDALRILQARAIRGYLRAEARQRGPFPLVLGGDFNPVGSFASVAVLSHDLFDEGTPMRGTNPRRLGDASLVTWESASSAQFAPGRLDLTFYRELTPRGGFVFTTEDLGDRLLDRLGMTPGTFARVADHFIVVNDFTR